MATERHPSADNRSSWLKNSIAVLFVGIFIVFLLVMISNIRSADQEWARYLVLFNVVQAFATTCLGFLLGATLKKEQTVNARDREKAATKDGAALRNAIQVALERSRASPTKAFRLSRPVRPQQTGETIAYVADAPAHRPTYWVVHENEAEGVDSELAGLAQLATNLFP